MWTSNYFPKSTTTFKLFFSVQLIFLSPYVSSEREDGNILNHRAKSHINSWELSHTHECTILRTPACMKRWARFRNFAAPRERPRTCVQHAGAHNSKSWCTYEDAERSISRSSDRPTIIVMISIFRACDFHVVLSSNEHISLCAQRAARDALFYTKCERARTPLYKIWARYSASLSMCVALCVFFLGRNLLLRKKRAAHCVLFSRWIYIVCAREFNELVMLSCVQGHHRMLNLISDLVTQLRNHIPLQNRKSNPHVPLAHFSQFSVQWTFLSI